MGDADAFFPADGQSSCDLDPMKPQILKALDEGVTALPPLPAAMLGVNEKDRAWVDAKCTPQPIHCFLQPITLTGARERIGPEPPHDSCIFRDERRGILKWDRSVHPTLVLRPGSSSASPIAFRQRPRRT
jgi:hypothetical protein